MEKEATFQKLWVVTFTSKLGLAATDGFVDLLPRIRQLCGPAHNLTSHTSSIPNLIPAMPEQRENDDQAVEELNIKTTEPRTYNACLNE